MRCVYAPDNHQSKHTHLLQRPSIIPVTVLLLSICEQTINLKTTKKIRFDNLKVMKTKQVNIKNKQKKSKK